MSTVTSALRRLPRQDQLALWQRCTDEKRVALAAIRANLPASRKHFLDIGGGGGEITIPLSEQFQRTTVFEPKSMYGSTYSNAPRICHIRESFNDQTIERLKADGVSFDLILLSHSLYFFNTLVWTDLISRLHDDLLAPKGQIQILMQSKRSQTAALLETFGPAAGCYYEMTGLEPLGQALRGLLPSSTIVTGATLPTQSRTPNDQELFQLALFYLADVTYNYSGHYQEIYDHCTSQFRSPAGGFAIDCGQDHLVITKGSDRPAPPSRWRKLLSWK